MSFHFALSRYALQAYISQLEAESGAPEGKALVRPSAAFAISVEWSIEGNATPPPLCVNVVTDESVDKPQLFPDTTTGTAASKRGARFNLPHIVGPLHFELPEEGGGVVVDSIATVDVCVHPNAVALARSSTAVHQQLCSLVADAATKQWRASAASLPSSIPPFIYSMRSEACVGGTPRAMLVANSGPNSNSRLQLRPRHSTTEAPGPAAISRLAEMMQSSVASTKSGTSTVRRGSEPNAENLSASPNSATQRFPTTPSGALLLRPEATVSYRSDFVLASMDGFARDSGSASLTAASDSAASQKSGTAAVVKLVLRATFPGVTRAGQLDVDLQERALIVSCCEDILVTAPASVVSDTAAADDASLVSCLRARVDASGTPAEMRGFSSRSDADVEDDIPRKQPSSHTSDVFVPIPPNGLSVRYALSLPLPPNLRVELDSGRSNIAAKFAVDTGVLTVTCDATRD